MAVVVAVLAAAVVVVSLQLPRHNHPLMVTLLLASAPKESTHQLADT